MPEITPCLWFDDQAKQAAELYTSVFPASKIERITYYGEEGQDTHGKAPGTVMTVEFTLDGQPFTALNGGPQFTFDEATSFEIACRDQAEIDRYWKALTADGGQGSYCGWLKDKFGLSWQVVPEAMARLLDRSDPEAADRVMAAMLEMGKLDIAALEAAHAGEA